MGALFCAVLMPLVAGCGDGPLDNVNPGSIGYQVVIDGSLTRSVEINSSTVFGGLPPGIYSVHLTNVALNCIVIEENPVTVIVVSDKKTIGSFGVQCFATLGL